MSMNERRFLPCSLPQLQAWLNPVLLVGCSDAQAAFALMIDACSDALVGGSIKRFDFAGARSIKLHGLKRAAPASWNISDAFKSSLNGAPLQRNCFSRSAALTGGKKGSGRNNCCRRGAGAAAATDVCWPF